MQRGHLSTIEFFRGILSPCFRKNLTTASIKYAEEKDKKKVDGMFSWLKDMLRPEAPNVSIRSIISCTRRNTNPPIREPNMPEKQEKKDEKKEKKKKKPVIRMEDGISEICPNEITTEAKNNLHDNLDVNFRYHRGFRLPEEGDNTEQIWNGSIQQLESIHCINDTNYSSYETTSVYNLNAIQTMKHLQLSMSSAKDSEKELSKVTLPNQELMNTVESGSTDAKKKDTESTETLKDVLENPTNESNETTVTDEDYNVPNSTAFDAEISAWKDLVLKSKIPTDPSKEEFLDGENPGNTRRVDMLSIRPEPPQPKLDVQAVPSSEDELMKAEEEESDVSKDLKGNLKATDVKLTGSTVDVQKANSKKLHTGSFFSSRKYGVNNFQGRLKLHDSLRILEFMDNDVSFFTSNYSTSAESSGWDRLDKSVAKEKDMGGEEMQSSHEELTTKNQPDLQENRMESLERNEAALDSKHDASVNFKREEQDVDKNYGDNMNVIPDDEIDSTLNHKVNRDTRESYRVSHRGSRKFETDDYMDAKFQDMQDNYDYTNSLYEDDFYPGYESMTLEPAAEKSVSSQPEEQQSQPPIITKNKEQKIFVNDEMFLKGENSIDKDQYVIDGSYVKWPGDPYPYSREHFDKWKLPHSDIHLGAPTNTDELHETLLNTPASSSSSDKRIDTQQPAQGQNLKDNESLSNVSNTLNLSNPLNNNDASATMDAAQADCGATELQDAKKIEKKETEPPSRVETIQPDINLASHGVNTNITRRTKKESNNKLVQQPEVVSLMLDDKQSDARYKEDDIRSLRNQQLLSVKKEEIEKIYEMKNYAYLRPEQMKNLRLASRSKPPTPNNPTDVNDPSVSTESN